MMVLGNDIYATTTNERMFASFAAMVGALVIAYVRHAVACVRNVAERITYSNSLRYVPVYVPAQAHYE